MNHTSFIRKLDDILSRLQKEEMRAYIEETASAVSEDEREEFLSLLSSFCRFGRKTSLKEDDLETNKEIDVILEKLDEINDGERIIGSSYNEEWLETQSHDIEPYDFSDSDGVIDDLKNAVSLLHTAVDREVYEKGSRLAVKLCALEVIVTGDCPDSPLTLDLLCSYKVIDNDANSIIREALYLVYMGENDFRRRARLMLTILDNFKYSSVTLGEVFETGEKVGDEQQFLPFWIEEVIDRPSVHAERLLGEAVMMMADKASILETAFNSAGTYPVIYRTILTRGISGASEKEMLETGLKAMAEVPVDSDERREISLLSADFALKSGDEETAWMCCFEAFRSSLDVIDFLRLRLIPPAWEKYKDKVREIYTSHMREEEEISKDSALLMFFDGRFEEVLAAMDDKEAHNWSSQFFLKCTVSLFLMLLTKEMEGRGIQKMVETAFEELSFTQEEYLTLTGIKGDTPSSLMFLNCFMKWKENFEIDSVTAALWIEKLGRIIDTRIESVMRNEMRGYYEECAAFIAALGEVSESRGMKEGYNHILEFYRKKYSRKRSFVTELRKYGS